MGLAFIWQLIFTDTSHFSFSLFPLIPHFPLPISFFCHCIFFCFTQKDQWNDRKRHFLTKILKQLSFSFGGIVFDPFPALFQLPFAFLNLFSTVFILFDCCWDWIILVIITNMYGVLIMCQMLFWALKLAHFPQLLMKKEQGLSGARFLLNSQCDLGQNT